MMSTRRRVRLDQADELPKKAVHVRASDGLVRAHFLQPITLLLLGGIIMLTSCRAQQQQHRSTRRLNGVHVCPSGPQAEPRVPGWLGKNSYAYMYVATYVATFVVPTYLGRLRT